jgi:porphobilinogen deaminase
LRLQAVIVAADGGTVLRASAGGPAAAAISLGREVAAELLRRGAGRYMAVSDGHISSGDGDR